MKCELCENLMREYWTVLITDIFSVTEKIGQHLKEFPDHIQIMNSLNDEGMTWAVKSLIRDARKEMR